jgi:AcrR family transcriptional regulator
LREQIVAAAERLLVETGSEQVVSIRAIADAVNVTPPSIYLHFDDKDDLLLNVCTRRFQLLEREVERAAEGAHDPLEALQLRMHAYVRFGVDQPEHYRILFMRRPEPREGEPAVPGGLEPVVGAVRACMDAGRFRPGSAEQVAVVLWAAVHGLTSLLITKPQLAGESAPQLADTLFDALMAGLQVV